MEISLHHGALKHRQSFPVASVVVIIPQAKMTLNMMSPCRQNPTLSEYTAPEGQFDFNKTPLAPPGIKLMALEKPEQRRTWRIHGITGWYIGPAM